MSSYRDELDRFLLNQRNQPFWDRHVPDELCAKIATVQDFVEFLQFADTHFESELLEYECEDTHEFIHKLSQRLTDERFLAHVNKLGIQSDLGRVALAMIFSWGD